VRCVHWVSFALEPVVESIATQAAPGDELTDCQLTTLMPVLDEIDDLISQFHLHPLFV